MLYNLNIASMLLGCLLKKPSLLELPQYPLTSNDFEPVVFHKLMFTVIYKLAKQGIQEATEIEVENIVKNHPSTLEVFQDNNFMDFIYTSKELCIPENFEYYYTTIKKFSLLRDLQTQGFDITEFYDELEDEESQNANLEKISIQDILNTIEYKSIELRSKYDIKYVRDEIVAGENTEKLIEAFEEVPAFGAFLSSPYVTQLFMGWCPGHLIMDSSPSGVGKALTNSMMIPMADGTWKYVRDVEVGDYLLDRQGNPTKVLGVFPQGKRQVWDFILEDGRSCLCSADHLWQTKSDIYTTQDIYNNMKKHDFYIPNSPLYYEYFKHKWAKIKTITPLDWFEDMTCFLVDNPEHLFLCNDYIVTHNTRISVADLCGVSVDTLWDDEANDFVPNLNYQGPGLFIHTELATYTEINPMFLACVSGVEVKHITMGNLTKEEKNRVLKAGEILQDNGLVLCDMADFTMKNIDRKIKESVEDYGMKYMVFDYVQLNSSITFEYRKNTAVQSREDLVLKYITTELKDMAEKYGIGIKTSSQLNGQEKLLDFPDESCLAGGKSQKNKLDCGSITLPVKDRQKEYKRVDPYIKKVGIKAKDNRPNLITYIYKSRFGEYADQKIKVWRYFDRGRFRNKDFICTDQYDNLIRIPKPVLKDF